VGRKEKAAGVKTLRSSIQVEDDEPYKFMIEHNYVYVARRTKRVFRHESNVRIKRHSRDYGKAYVSLVAWTEDGYKALFDLMAVYLKYSGYPTVGRWMEAYYEHSSGRGLGTGYIYKIEIKRLKKSFQKYEAEYWLNQAEARKEHVIGMAMKKVFNNA
jgi:hypothetical protein